MVGAQVADTTFRNEIHGEFAFLECHRMEARRTLKMPICSYLVIPESGAKDQVRRRLARAEGCEVVEAENRDILILLTDTGGLEEEELLRSAVEEMDGIEALLFTFGEVDPETDLADPIRVGRRPRGGATDRRDDGWMRPGEDGP